MIARTFAGFMLVLSACGLLFWNEGRAVKTARSLDQGAGIVVAINADSPDGEQSGKLVHFSGQLVPQGQAEDTLFPQVKAKEGFSRLLRNVEMLQWVEVKTRKSSDGESGSSREKLSYEKKWMDTPIDSSRFQISDGHENPAMDLESETFGVASGTVGQINLSGKLFRHLGEEWPVVPDDAARQAVATLLGQGRDVAVNGSFIVVRSNPAEPSVGDLRISFKQGGAETVSAIGRLDGDSLRPFASAEGRKLLMVREGKLGAQEMFEQAHDANSAGTVFLRFGGFIAMFCGFLMAFSILGELTRFIPVIGTATRSASKLVSFALSVVLSSFIIAMAWILHRPLIALAVLAVGAAFAAWIILRERNKRAEQPPEAPEAPQAEAESA